MTRGIDGMKDKMVLVTGGAGSFGSAFIKEALNLSPKGIRIIDNNEDGLVRLQDELKDPRLRFMFADIKDKDRLHQLMGGVEIVIHSAALKHIPVCEYNPGEAVKTNIMGSLNVMEVAIDSGVNKVLGISSDKAVHPVSSYGASKLVMEKIFLEANSYTQTHFSCVRFGNLWGSRGSVVERWMQQRMTGEPITVTEKDMMRFFIDIDEAVRFSFTCVERMKGGEIFIPIMPSYTLAELANQIAPECEVKVIGRRKGEKKKELLVSEDEEKFVERQNDCLIIRYT